MENVGIHELLTLLALVAAFAGATFGLKLPVGVALVIASVVGAIVGGQALPVLDLVRHLVEGTMAYLDAIMVIACATIFMKAIESSGLLGSLANALIRAFARQPWLLLAAAAFLIMFPGMMTGSSTAAVLTTGAMMVPVFVHMGIPRPKVGAIIALCALLGMAAPPVSILALIIGAGIDLPYVGLDVPLLVLSIPPALAFTWALGLPHCRKLDLAADAADLPRSVYAAHGIKLFIPLLVVVALMLVERLGADYLQLGLPLVFLLGAAAAAITGERFNVLTSARSAMEAAIPVLAILVGVGMFIQVMTLTGARGEIVVQAMQLPRGWGGLYPVIGTTLPVFGAVSSFGAASVLGIPYTLALPMDGTTIIINVAALVLIASLGDLMPPTALASIFAAQVAGVKNYFHVLKHCLIPAVILVIIGLLFIQFAEPLGKALVFF
jgi:TRAP-type C4-dicarboxylate transport system permease large subunit